MLLYAALIKLAVHQAVLQSLPLVPYPHTPCPSTPFCWWGGGRLLHLGFDGLRFFPFQGGVKESLPKEPVCWDVVWPTAELLPTSASDLHRSATAFQGYAKAACLRRIAIFTPIPPGPA